MIEQHSSLKKMLLLILLFTCSPGLWLPASGSGPESCDNPIRVFVRGETPITLELCYLCRQGSSQELQILSSNTFLAEGDWYGMTLRASEDAYVYIFELDERDEIVRIFPPITQERQKYAIGNPVRKGNRYAVPVDNRLKQLGKPRITDLFVLASASPDRKLEKQIKRLTEAKNSNDNYGVSIAIGELNKALRDRHLSHLELPGRPDMLLGKHVDAASMAPQILRMLFATTAAAASDGSFRGDSSSSPPIPAIFYLFEAGSETIRPESIPVLYEYGKALRELGSDQIGITSHTDSFGSEDQAIELSRRRANAVRNFFLREFELSLPIKAYGDTEPLFASGITELLRLNNRIEFRWLKTEE